MKLFLLLIIIITSCGDNSNSNISSTDSGSTISSGSVNSDTATTTGTDTVVYDATNDTLINVSFPKDSTWAKIKGKLRGISHPVTVLIPVKQGKQLSASLQTDDVAANIRINQIFMPNGKADGPFGRDIKYPIKTQGTYKLIIGENMMQGDEWKGSFNLTIAVK